MPTLDTLRLRLATLPFGSAAAVGALARFGGAAGELSARATLEAGLLDTLLLAPLFNGRPTDGNGSTEILMGYRVIEEWVHYIGNDIFVFLR